jgi:Dna[CI] antecedent DciA-like protein
LRGDGRGGTLRPMSDPKPVASGVWRHLVRPGSGLDGDALSAWAASVGAAAVPRAVPWTLHDGLLTVRVPSSTWAQDLSLRRAELLRRLGAELGAERVRELRFVVVAEGD